ncbi:hypothetical protein ACRQ1B_06205 [Rhizobium panacihumi]|uniref:hypothetical protein n=1 Tax=Rhizobium panacihumi TaxID=2008450 RepID=UPI003D7985C3
MPLAEKLVKLAELAEALDRSEDWVKRNWLKLHLEKGMPRKLTIGWSWPRSSMEHWLEEGAGGAIRIVEAEPAPMPAVPASNVIALAAITANQNHFLRHRYSGGRA